MGLVLNYSLNIVKEESLSLSGTRQDRNPGVWLRKLIESELDIRKIVGFLTVYDSIQSTVSLHPNNYFRRIFFKIQVDFRSKLKVIDKNQFALEEVRLPRIWNY